MYIMTKKKNETKKIKREQEKCEYCLKDITKN